MAHYKGYYVVLEIPDQDFNEWKETLKNEMSRIYNSLKTRIKDRTLFEAKIAEPSHEVWKDFVAPDWEDRDLILQKHKVKLKGAYDAWLSGVEKCFGEGGYFAQRVEDKAEKFKMVKYTLGSTGLRYKYGRGIAVKAIGIISGMKRVKHDIQPDENEYWDGEVVNAFLPGAARFVRPQAVAIITQGLVIAQYAVDIGDVDTARNIASLVNQKLANTVLKQVDTANWSVTLQLGYDDAKGRLFVESKATPAGGA